MHIRPAKVLKKSRHDKIRRLVKHTHTLRAVPEEAQKTDIKLIACLGPCYYSFLLLNRHITPHAREGKTFAPLDKGCKGNTMLPGLVAHTIILATREAELGSSMLAEYRTSSYFTREKDWEAAPW